MSGATRSGTNEMRRGRNLLWLLPVVFLAAFYCWPIASIIWRGLSDSGRPSLSPILDVAESASLRSVLWFTFWQAVVSTVLTALVAAPLTVTLGRWRMRGSALILALVTVPFVLPTVVVASAFISLIDRFGLDGDSFSIRHSTTAILAAHVFFNVAVVVRTIVPLWSQLDPAPEQAARTLGASPLRAFIEVTWPRLRRAVASALTLVFLFTFTSFALVLILGGPRKATLETEIYRYAVNRTEFDTAAALAVIQLVSVLGLIWIGQKLRETGTGRSMTGTEQLTDAHLRAPVGRQRWFAIAAMVGTAAILLLPILTLVEQAFSGAGGWTVANWSALGDRPPILPVSALRAVVNSIGFAIAATGLAVVVGGIAAAHIAWGRSATSRLLDAGLLLPLGTSAVTLGFGMLLALDSPVDLRGSWIIVPIAQALIGIPFVVRTVVPLLRSIEDSAREAAATLGANQSQVRREIDLPVARRALTIGAGFAFAVSMGEFGATSFVGRNPDHTTVPLAIERLLSQPGTLLRGQAMALSALLMLLTAGVLLIASRRSRGPLF